MMSTIKQKLKSFFRIEKSENNNRGYADAIIRNNEGKILLLLRGTETDFEPRKWGLPGGHIDKGEDPETAVKREVLEETNIEIENCNLVHTKESEGGLIYYYDCFLQHKDNTIILVNNEHYNYKWASYEEWNEMDLLLDLKDVLNKLNENSCVEKSVVDNLIRKIDSYEKEYYNWKEGGGVHTKESVLEFLENNHQDDMTNPVIYFLTDRVLNKQVEKSFQIIKDGFDLGLVDEDKFLESLQNYNDIIKGHYKRNKPNDKLNRSLKEYTPKRKPNFKKHEYFGKEINFDTEKKIWVDKENNQLDSDKANEFIDLKVKHDNYKSERHKVSAQKNINKKQVSILIESRKKQNSGINRDLKAIYLDMTLSKYGRTYFDANKEYIENSFDILSKTIKKSEELKTSFELIKKAFDDGLIDEEKYLEACVLYSKLKKGDIDSYEEEKSLEDHAKEAAEHHLERVVKESPHSELREVAHIELDRRMKKEYIQEEEEKVKKKPKKKK